MRVSHRIKYVVRSFVEIKEGCHMTSFTIPMSVVVIGHDIYDIKIFAEGLHVITGVDDLLAWAHGR